MSSINFNESAMTALNTLQNINRNLADVQDQISTGKKISTARDNAAIWAISTVMESDVMSFKTITDSLNLGSSTVNVARSAAEQVTKLLQQTKALIVSSQEENVDRSSIQRDVDALKDQIASIVDSAQFNGLNLLKGGADVSLLSSLNRDNNNVVTATEINVSRADLRQTDGVFGTTAITGAAGEAAVSGATVAAAGTGTVTLTAGEITAGDSFRMTVGGVTAEYIAGEGQTLNDVTQGLVDEMNRAFAALNSVTPGSAPNVNLVASSVSDPAATNSTIQVVNQEAGGGADYALAASSFSGGTAGGALGKLVGLDVTTDAGAAAALADIESMIQATIDATAAFGSAQNRIDIQNDFVSALIQSLEAGVSALTDANLEEASARLQSLQVQQQLNIQALTIANQSPQAILALFR